jgi:hypothetical protein
MKGFRLVSMSSAYVRKKLLPVLRFSGSGDDSPRRGTGLAQLGEDDEHRHDSQACKPLHDDVKNGDVRSSVDKPFSTYNYFAWSSETKWRYAVEINILSSAIKCGKKSQQLKRYRGPELFVILEVIESMVGPPAERCVWLAAFLWSEVIAAKSEE